MASWSVARSVSAKWAGVYTQRTSFLLVGLNSLRHVFPRDITNREQGIPELARILPRSIGLGHLPDLCQLVVSVDLVVVHAGECELPCEAALFLASLQQQPGFGVRPFDESEHR